MIYAFSSASGAVLLSEADDSGTAREALLRAGYAPLEEEGAFEAMGSVLVVRSIGGTDVYVSESRG